MGETMEVIGPRAGASTKKAALIELTLFLALVFSFIWVWSHAFPHASLVVYFLGLCLTVGTHVIHRETPEDLGVRLDNLGVAAKEAAVCVLPIVGLLLATGFVRGGSNLEALDAERFLRVTAWGFLQQYLLQGFVHRRLAALIERPVGREVAVAAIFAALHLPNPILTPATFVAGYLFAVLYRRHPNLLVLAFCHAIGSTAVAFAFGPQTLHNMRVGPGYFKF